MRKFDPTKPVQTRNGRVARILAADIKSDYTVLAAIQQPDGSEVVLCFTSRGRFYGLASDEEDGRDLVNVPVKHILEQWVNVYFDNRKGPFAYNSSRDADASAGPDRAACVHVRQEYTEGEGLL